ncbi:MAG: sulfur carrier protein ThiS [Deltaproteobacteria bacterium]|nr:sulfur carrier protein ThiS [Deltaproteobacteria bacterium]
MGRINIVLNGREFVFESGVLNIIELLNKLGIKPEGIAVCVNEEIVKKKDYFDYFLEEGDKVDIITMVGGG